MLLEPLHTSNERVEDMLPSDLFYCLDRGKIQF
jgi:hypothetical protein